MSEKVYTFLLRFFPTAFRRQYQEESLRLFRDRLRDERGLLRRLRLTLDLVVDVFGALPLAYRNSYASVSASSSLSPQLDGVPAFRTLPQEPIRREVILLASVMAITALAVFPFVLSRANSYRSPEPHGRKSAIESAIESANEPISPAPTHIPSAFDATSPAPAAVQSGATASAASQTAQQNPKAVSSVDSSPAVAAISATNTSPVPVMVNLSGRWSGSSAATGGANDMPQSFDFSQDSVRLTGTALSAATGPAPILHGVVDGDSVSFEVASGEASFRYDLKIEGQGLRGALSIKTRDGVRSTLVSFKRAR